MIEPPRIWQKPSACNASLMQACCLITYYRGADNYWNVISTEGRLNRRERFEQPTKFAWSKIERPKVGLKGELQDVIRNAGPKGELQDVIRNGRKRSKSPEPCWPAWL
jgi:hypothetical protein